MDLSRFDDALRSDFSPEPMSEKQVVYVQDSNGGSYNGQIKIDSRILSNQELYNDYSEAHLSIPYRITTTANADISGAGIVNGFHAGLKCGYHNLIHQVQVSLNGQSVVQQTPFTNMFVSYKMMTTWSKDDVEKYGALTAFYPDTAGTTRYTAGAIASGNGHSDNTVALPSADGLHIWRLGATANGALRAVNEGYLRRLELCSFPITTNDQGSGNCQTLNTANQADNIGKNYISDNAGAGANRIWTWNILAVIRLKDLCDFFDKMPITKGAYITMTISYNSSTDVVTFAGGPGANTMVSTSTALNSGGTNPLMVASSALNNPNDSITDARVLTYTCNIGGSYLANGVRLYVPTYKLKPEYEKQLLEENPVKKFKFCDIEGLNTETITAGQNFRRIITNSVKNPKSVVVIPQLNQVSNDGLNPLQSPFGSSPHTTAPFGCIDSFNVQLNGKNVFQEQHDYDFESFKNELAQMGCIDGGSLVGLCNGLIGFADWDASYRYYVANLGRYSSLSPGSSMSVVVQGNNNTSASIDYYVFIEREKEIAIEMITGKIVSLDD